MFAVMTMGKVHLCIHDNNAHETSKVNEQQAQIKNSKLNMTVCDTCDMCFHL